MDCCAHLVRDQAYTRLVRKAVGLNRAQLAIGLIYRRNREYIRYERLVRAYIDSL